MATLSEIGNNSALDNMGKWRQLIWPVHGSELGKFLPLFFMKLCVSFNYSVLNATKDTIVVTGTGGAEVIPVLKGGVVLIIAFLAMLFYSKLNNQFSRTKVFYIIITPLLLFFFIYGSVLFPKRELLIPVTSADWLISIFGNTRHHWIAVYKYWMDSSFFVLAELWGGLMISVLFWGLANHITNIKDAIRFYALYTVGGHIGTFLAGILTYATATLMNNQDFEHTIYLLMLIVSAVGVIIMCLYWWANKNVVVTERSAESKTKLSLKDSINYIVRSPYLGLIALMVIGYGLSVNLVEVTWKALLQLQFPDPSAYQAYMGMIQFILGISSFLLALFFSGNVIRRYGWYISAQLTPIVLGVTSLLFFLIYFMFPDVVNSKTTILSFSPLMLLVICGTLHNVACKSMKYCLFDPTKEIAYIPLDRESKVKGKAAVDLVGARFGKTGASWLQLGLIDLIGAGSILGAVPLLVPSVVVVVAFWLIAVHNLNKRFINIQQTKASELAPIKNYVPA